MGWVIVLVVWPSHHFVIYVYLHVYVIILSSSGAGTIDSSDAALPKDSVLPTVLLLKHLL
jgi:hypothetical protein